MATLNGNNAFLSFNGISLGAYWTGVISKDTTADTIDTTAGSGQTHMERAPGLIDGKISFAVMYDDAALSTIITALVVGTSAPLIYGPEGSTTGKPKFAGTHILKSVKGPNAGIKKPAVMFELDFEQAATPTHTIEGGSTF